MARSAQALKIVTGEKKKMYERIHYVSHKHTCNTLTIREKLTRKEAKCSDVITALNPTTGTNAASNVPKTTCSRKIMRIMKFD